MDSTMATELRNRLESNLKLTLPIMALLWSYPSVHALSTYLSEEMGIIGDDSYFPH
jgi:acyl carrier protein